MRIAFALAAVACASVLQAPVATAGFAPGQCTAWAYEMRPEIVAGTELADPTISDWTAYRWAANARVGGFSVGNRPVPGAIANAVFDATGVRIRRAPFSPDYVKSALS